MNNKAQNLNVTIASKKIESVIKVPVKEKPFPRGLHW
jgi:hypothetical protein